MEGKPHRAGTYATLQRNGKVKRGKTKLELSTIQVCLFEPGNRAEPDSSFDAYAKRRCHSQP
jgi:hypothetical protein